MTTTVIGHRNPDTDAIVSAIGYAWMLNQHSPDAYIPARAGGLNPQTLFALDHFGIEQPILVADVRPRVRDVAELLDPLPAGSTVLDACQRIATARRSLPLLDAHGAALGLVSGAGLFAYLADALGTPALDARLRETAARALDPTPVDLPADAYIQEVLPGVLRSDQDEYLVREEHYAGVCRKADLLTPPRRRLILVDHNEPSQAVPGLEDAELVEVMDHHRINPMATLMPIRFFVDPVGSTSTLVSERADLHVVVFVPEIAGLLLCGILSDTLVFRSPTTTERDRSAARKLAALAALDPFTFGQQLLAAGAGLGTRLAEEIVAADQKSYDVGRFRVSISQVEVTHFNEIEGRLDALAAALRQQVTIGGYALGMLMITDVVRADSRLLLEAADSRLINALPYPQLDGKLYDAPGVVSRKKQLLPSVLAALLEV